MTDGHAPQRNPLGWWILFALIVLVVAGGLAWNCDQERQARDAAERYRQEEIDHPGFHELQRRLHR